MHLYVDDIVVQKRNNHLFDKAVLIVHRLEYLPNPFSGTLTKIVRNNVDICRSIAGNQIRRIVSRKLYYFKKSIIKALNLLSREGFDWFIGSF